ncbi:unnamed protein product [Linum trigynum]|uniref:Uncharacterized protein n=1 Tax=Linum trigynum TaxID=586398 RepID=A0AAV2FIF2_9ROSI
MKFHPLLQPALPGGGGSRSAKQGENCLTPRKEKGAPSSHCFRTGVAATPGEIAIESFSDSQNPWIDLCSRVVAGNSIPAVKFVDI